MTNPPPSTLTKLYETHPDWPHACLEASHWVAKLASKTASAAEKRAFKVWIGQSPLHAAAADHVSMLWTASRLAPSLKAPPKSITPKSWTLAWILAWVRRPINLVPLGALAAALLIVPVAWRGGHTPETGPLQTDAGPLKTVKISKATVKDPAADASTAPMSQDQWVEATVEKVLTLTDQTKITLSPKSRVRITETVNLRQVTLLKGSARFNVTHDLHRPFVVLVGRARVYDLGTAFVIKPHQKGHLVAVTEGRVKLLTASESSDLSSNPGLVLGVGQSAIIQTGGQEIIRILPRAILIHDSQLEARNAPLAEVVTTLNQHAKGPRLDLSPELSGLKVNGSFDLESTRSAALVLADVLPIRLNFSDPGRIEMTPRSDAER